MTSLPTLIVLADPTLQYGAEPHAMATLAHTLRVGLESGLPMVLVAPPAAAEHARSILPSNDIVELSEAHSVLSRTDTMAQAVSAGVLASPHAPGWLLWPADMSDVQADTLRLMGRSVGHYPMVFPQFRQQRGHPVGLSAEFFSELIRLHTERDLTRLMTRYPALGIDVNDPGILESDLPHASLGQLRTQLQGVPVGAPSSAAMALA